MQGSLSSALILPGMYPQTSSAGETDPEGGAYSFQAELRGEPFYFSQFKDRVTIIVNIASEWPLNNVNYPSLRYLLEKYEKSGFSLVAAPCNQFGYQAPGSSEEERQAAIRKFGVEFPVIDKILVNGPDAHPLYKFLKRKQPVSVPNASGKGSLPGGAIEWNYTKFLINRDGIPVKRFKPAFDPLEMEGDVRLLLSGKDVLPGECTTHPGRKVCNVDRILSEQSGGDA